MSSSSPRHWIVKDKPALTAFAAGVDDTVPAWKRPRLAAPRGLRFTELLFLFAIAFAYFETVSEPLFGIQLHQTILKYVPLILLAPAFALHFIGVRYNRGTKIWGPCVAAVWPMVALALYIMGGSLWAKYEDGSGTTFITLGVYLGLLPIYAAMTVEGNRIASWVSALTFIWVAASVTAFAGELAHPGYVESLHEIEYVVTSGFFLLYYASGRSTVRALAIIMMLGAAILNHKLTGYICGALAIMHIVVAAGWHRLSPHWRGFYGVSAVISCLAVAGLMTLLYFEFRRYLPSGSTEVRLAQYDQAMRQFFDSPIWGAAYTQGSGEGFQEGGRSLYIPTHSDILDLLKHGGLIAFALFTTGYWKLFKLIHGAVTLTRDDRRLNAYFLGARFFMITALASFAVNPLLLKGPFVVVIWGNLGLAAGIAIAVKARTAKPEAGMVMPKAAARFRGMKVHR